VLIDGSVQQEKVVRGKKKKRDQDLEIREDWKKETVKVFYSRTPLPLLLPIFSRDHLYCSGRTNLAQECPSFQHFGEATSNPMGHPSFHLSTFNISNLSSAAVPDIVRSGQHLRYQTTSLTLQHGSNIEEKLLREN